MASSLFTNTPTVQYRPAYAGPLTDVAKEFGRDTQGCHYVEVVTDPQEPAKPCKALGCFSEESDAAKWASTMQWCDSPAQAALRAATA